MPRKACKVGTVRAPPDCGHTTTPPPTTGSAWQVDARAVALPTAGCVLFATARIRRVKVDGVAAPARVEHGANDALGIEQVAGGGLGPHRAAADDQLRDHRDAVGGLHDASPPRQPQRPPFAARAELHLVGGAVPAAARSSTGGTRPKPRSARRSEAPRSRRPRHRNLRATVQRTKVGHRTRVPFIRSTHSHAVIPGQANARSGSACTGGKRRMASARRGMRASTTNRRQMEASVTSCIISRGEVRALICGPSTVAWMLLVRAACPAAPSPSTIAPARGLPPVGAMLSM